jgi:hypothetical protein
MDVSQSVDGHRYTAQLRLIAYLRMDREKMMRGGDEAVTSRSRRGRLFDVMGRPRQVDPRNRDARASRVTTR